MRVFQAVGIPCPESSLGFGVGGVEPTLASLRAKIMGALIVTGKKADFPRIESLAANRVYRRFRYGVDLGHGLTSLKWLFDARVIDGSNVTVFHIIIPIFEMAS